MDHFRYRNPVKVISYIDMVRSIDYSCKFPRATKRGIAKILIMMCQPNRDFLSWSFCPQFWLPSPCLHQPSTNKAYKKSEPFSESTSLEWNVRFLFYKENINDLLISENMRLGELIVFNKYVYLLYSALSRHLKSTYTWVNDAVGRLFASIWILSFTFNILQFFAACALLSGTDFVSHSLSPMRTLIRKARVMWLH